MRLKLIAIAAGAVAAVPTAMGLWWLVMVKAVAPVAAALNAAAAG